MSNHLDLISSSNFCVISTHTECYVCLAQTPVFALGLIELTTSDPHGRGFGEDDDDGTILHCIEELNAPVSALLQTLTTNFKLDTSLTMGRKYWMNHCAYCGAKLGDHYIHSEPDVVFFPTCEEGFKRMTFTWFPTELRAVASLSRGSMSRYMKTTSNLQGHKVIRITKKPSRAKLLDVIVELQGLVGEAQGAFYDDRASDRADQIKKKLQVAFDLCVSAHRFDPASTPPARLQRSHAMRPCQPCCQA